MVGATTLDHMTTASSAFSPGCAIYFTSPYEARKRQAEDIVLETVLLLGIDTDNRMLP